MGHFDTLTLIRHSAAMASENREIRSALPFGTGGFPWLGLVQHHSTISPYRTF
jgi:hypothetical protein